MADNEKRNARYSTNGCHMKTKASYSEYQFIWTVERFSKCLKTLRSAPFRTPLASSNFQAVLKVSVDKFQLYFKSPQEFSDTMQVHSEVQDCNGRTLHKERGFRQLPPEITDINCHLALLPPPNAFFFHAIKNVSSDALSKIKQLPEDTVIFKCLIENCVHSTQCETYRFQTGTVQPSRGLSALSNDLKTMYGVSLYADVEVHVGDNVLRAHKSILCARSPVFARMFQNPMDERAKNVIDITDVELPVVKNLLSFLYTGSLCDDSFEAVHDLYYAADKYDVSNLREECSDVLLSKMDVENACSTLTLASRHSDEDLKNSVMAYIQFYIDAVLKTDSWNDLVSDEPKLASEVKSSRGEKRTVESDK